MKTWKFALIQTLPVLFGYLFLGVAFGLVLQNAGYNFLWALLISTIVFAGSMQFVLVSLLGTGIDLLSVALLTLTINSRHMFYGLTFIKTFKAMGKAYPYMIFSLSDETYSLLCSTQPPVGMNKNKVFMLIAILNQAYWVLGSLIGAIIGQLIPLNSTGIDFAMTALFLTIFVEQWVTSKTRIPACIGIFSGLASIFLFGTAQFILPALILSVGLLIAGKPYIAKRELLL